MYPLSSEGIPSVDGEAWPSAIQTPPHVPAPFPRRLERRHASKILRLEVDTYLSKARSWLADGREGSPPRLCIAGETGLGKTDIVLRALASPEWTSETKLILVPTIDLAEELAVRARAYGHDPLVVRGRSQPRPEADGRMCAKHEVAEAVAALGENVSDNLCRTRTKGEEKLCPFYEECAYVRQLREIKSGRGRLLIGTHSYLDRRPDVLQESKIGLLVVDESHWQGLVSSSTVDLARFAQGRAIGTRGFQRRDDEGALEHQARKSEADTRFFDAILDVRDLAQRAMDESRQPTIAEFRALGFDRERLGFLQRAEWSRHEEIDLTPDMPVEVQRERLAAAVQREIPGFARVWKTLSAEIESGRDGELHGLRIDPDAVRRDGSAFVAIRLDVSRDPRFLAVPALLIDGSADEAITERFWPGTRFVAIAAEWSGNVRIVQAIDKTGSMHSLRGERRIEDIRWLCRKAVDETATAWRNDEAARPVLITVKALADTLRQEGGRSCYGLDIEHYGAIRGIDRYKNSAAVVLGGRIEPSPAEIERLTRAIWHASPDPIRTLTAEESVRGLPKGVGEIRQRDGTSVTVATNYHPDPRCMRILRAVRDGELVQAMARIRPVHRSTPCTVVVLTNVPLPVPVDATLTWDEIVPCPFERARLTGFLPDSLADLAAAHPSLFPSHAAARKAASRRGWTPCDAAGSADERELNSDKSHLWLSNGERHTFERMVRVEYRLPGPTGERRVGRGGWVAWNGPGTTEEAYRRVLEALPAAEDLQLIEPLVDDPSDRVDLVESVVVWAGERRLADPTWIVVPRLRLAVVSDERIEVPPPDRGRVTERYRCSA